MRFLPILFVLSFVVLAGCVDRPEVGPAAYGIVVDQLPHLQEAEDHFKFPYAGDNDHRNCEFKEEDFF